MYESVQKPQCTSIFPDITQWEKKIVWPDLSEERIKACCEKYMSLPTYHPDKMNYYDIGQGCTERLVAVLGGYTEAMLALAEEPEACRAAENITRNSFHDASGIPRTARAVLFFAQENLFVTGQTLIVDGGATIF